MTDYSELVKRLREIGTNLALEDDYQIAYKSADAIEALQARVAEMWKEREAQAEKWDATCAALSAQVEQLTRERDAALGGKS
jgi:prefoldin subunit 5